MVKQDKIGTTYNVTLNGIKYTVTISQNPEEYEFYRTLGLDVFEEDLELNALVEEIEYLSEEMIKESLKSQLDELGIRYRKNSSIETLRSKLEIKEEE